MTYEENKQLCGQLVGTRKFQLEQTKKMRFWIQDDGKQVEILEVTASKSLRVENPQKVTVAFVPMDGLTGTFSSPPPVRDEAPFIPAGKWFAKS